MEGVDYRVKSTLANGKFDNQWRRSLDDKRARLHLRFLQYKRMSPTFLKMLAVAIIIGLLSLLACAQVGIIARIVQAIR